MRILTRYVLKEFLVPLCYCLTGFIAIYVLFDLFGSFSRMVSAKMSLSDAVLYLCGYLSPYFHYLVPAALMLATIYTMWMFCRHSEIIAMRASGVSFMAIVKPLLAVAFLLAGAVVYVNEKFMPAYAQWASQMKTVKFSKESIVNADNIVFRNSAACRTWDVNEMEGVDGAHLKGVRVMVDRPNGGGRLMTVTADRADYLDGEWWFTATKVQHYAATGQEIATKTPALDELRVRCFPEFDDHPSDFIMQNRPWRFNSVSDRMRYLQIHDRISEHDRNECLYDIWAQIMAPWACIIITLFAIPAGIASGRQSVVRGVIGALALYFSFYGVTIGMMILAKNGWCPPIPAAILPAVVFLGLGIRAFYKQR